MTFREKEYHKVKKTTRQLAKINVGYAVFKAKSGKKYVSKVERVAVKGYGAMMMPSADGQTINWTFF